MSLATVLAFAANSLAKDVKGVPKQSVKDDKKPEKESDHSQQNG